ncbi:alpha/beta hydrolase family protein [Aquipseudomonas campi]
MPHSLRPLLLALSLGLALPALGEDTPAAPTDNAPAPADNTGQGERPALEERSAEGAMALERRLPATEQQLLGAEDETFLALWKPANVGDATGVVILIPATGEHADWPNVIGPLRSKLPDAGWSSLSLTLPDPAPALDTTPLTDTGAPDGNDGPSTTADTGTAPATSDNPQSSVKDPATRILARIEAGIAFAEQQQAKEIVLLGHGDGAYWAARFLAERKPAKVKHLLVIAAQVPTGAKPSLEELIPGLRLSTGDLYYKELNADRSAASRRLQASKRLQHPTYIQVGLTTLPGNQDAEQEQLYRRARGWLDKVLPAAK